MLSELKDKIEGMSKTQQLEVLRILTRNSNVNINENNNGTFINLTELSEDIINSLRKYVVYVEEQQKDLLKAENEKSRLQSEYFKDNKETVNIKI
tara:strand:+ start:2294 stop:2578 length:285 start_codon:yes stop_codon:yes gene_type:complete